MAKSKSQGKATTQKTRGEGKPSQARGLPPRHDVLSMAIGLFLILATLVTFWKVGGHEFVTFDDNDYITDNPSVKAGLTLGGVVWAFTTTHASNWHPLTWLSHMVDCTVYGLDPAGHHVTNLLFHIANALLLFLVFRKMTGAIWESGFVAAVFALHPLHVESVAWVAERKDVLSTFFWMVTIWTYARYVKEPKVGRYLLALLVFALGLLSKPMVITLPLIMLLLDYWPLGRFQSGQGKGDLVLEKVPFFLLSVASSFLTFFAQQTGGTVKSLQFFPLEIRIANALVSYVKYIGKMIWPQHLAVLYPYPGEFSIGQTAGAGLLLAGVSVLVIRAARRRPYLAVGWLWYLVTLVPVIGLVQVGMQAMADRYTYVPLVGLFIMVAWGFPGLLKEWRYRRIVLAGLGSLLVLILMIVTWVQVRCWQSSITLFHHTLEVTEDNFLIHNKLGNVLFQEGRIDEAMTYFREALRINPHFVEAENNMGNVLFRQGRIDEAVTHYREALRSAPDYADAHYNLGFALARQGKMAEAIAHYQEALRIKPDFAQARYNLGLALADQGKNEEALIHFGKSLENKSGDADAHNNLGVALARQGKRKEALIQFSKALETDPNFAEAHCNMGNSLTELGRVDEAIGQYREALRIKPDYPMARYNLGNVLFGQGKMEEAIGQYTEALRTQPNFSEARFSLSLAYWMTGNRTSALDEYRILKTINPELADVLSRKILK